MKHQKRLALTAQRIARRRKQGAEMNIEAAGVQPQPVARIVVTVFSNNTTLAEWPQGVHPLSVAQALALEAAKIAGIVLQREQAAQVEAHSAGELARLPEPIKRRLNGAG